MKKRALIVALAMALSTGACNDKAEVPEATGGA